MSVTGPDRFPAQVVPASTLKVGDRFWTEAGWAEVTQEDPDGNGTFRAAWVIDDAGGLEHEADHDEEFVLVEDWPKTCPGCDSSDPRERRWRSCGHGGYMHVCDERGPCSNDWHRFARWNKGGAA